MHTIPFNIPAIVGTEVETVTSAILSGKLLGDGPFTRKCQQRFTEQLGSKSSLMVPSGTHALEMAAILANIRQGDEVIMPSYTFVSTANAFVLRGARIVFVDIRPDTMNIDENKIERAITSKTRAIVPVHYAGVGCNMPAIMDIAKRYSLVVIEDAAQAINATYDGKPLGSFGHMSAFSFHETKNITSGGEGGLIAINDPKYLERAEIIREKGTNRSRFLRGEVDKYTWVDVGSSYLPSELQAAYLWAQLDALEKITEDRMITWNRYYNGLKFLEEKGRADLPRNPPEAQHNAHIFYIKVGNINERTTLIQFLKSNGVHAVFHYVPLHSAPAGKTYGSFFGEDKYTTLESERLLRLPLFYGMKQTDTSKVIDLVNDYFK